MKYVEATELLNVPLLLRSPETVKEAAAPVLVHEPPEAIVTLAALTVAAVVALVVNVPVLFILMAAKVFIPVLLLILTVPPFTVVAPETVSPVINEFIANVPLVLVKVPVMLVVPVVVAALLMVTVPEAGAISRFPKVAVNEAPVVVIVPAVFVIFISPPVLLLCVPPWLTMLPLTRINLPLSFNVPPELIVKVVLIVSGGLVAVLVTE
jgi:hypothetical protein